MNEIEYQSLTDEFQSEQHAMHRKINEWRRWWKELSDIGQPRFGELHDRLRSIRDHLAAHFQHEEQSGFFQRVIEIEPECADQATALLAEHQKFLNDLNRLCTKLGPEEPEFESWGEANQAFEEFLRELEQHEKQEHALFVVWKDSEKN
jgi:hypothetical protein